MNDTIREEERIKRRKNKKKHKVAKGILMFICAVVIALGAFVLTIKICKPDFDFKTLVPHSVLTFVKEDVLKQTTTAPTTTKATTAPTTTKKYANYVPAEDFAFNTSNQGNQIGNILNKTNGAVTFNSSYIYFSRKGSGIYRFAPNEETTSKLAFKVKNAESLNIMGDYLYFVDSDSHTLIRGEATGSTSMKVQENVKTAYGYDGTIWYVSTDNKICTVKGDGSGNKVLYSAGEDKKLKLVGISLSGVYFTSEDKATEMTEFITVSNDGMSKHFFREDAQKGEIKSMQLEGGYLYYFKKNDGYYSLIRQKFGSEKTVTLLKKASVTDYPVIYSNRLYYGAIDDGNYLARELNMNTNTKKTMLRIDDADNSGSLSVACGFQYIFLIGSKSKGGDYVCRGSCIYTSSSKDNVMYFSSGVWKY